MNKIVNFFLVFILITSCSFDKKTGIWSGGEQEKKRITQLEKEQKQTLETIKISSSEDFFSKEIIAIKNAKNEKEIQITSWEMPGLNLQNFQSNFYLSGINNKFLKKKIGKNKFKISKVMSSPLFYQDNIIMTDDVGNIFSVNKNGKTNWKKNIYKKVYKKIYKSLSYSVYKNKLYVSDNIGFIYSININNGEIYWIKNHGIPLKSKIKVFDDKIFLINQDNTILCLNTKDGIKIWDLRTVSSFIKSQTFLSIAISNDGNIFALNSSGDLFKIRANTGGVYWTLNTTGSLYAHDTDFFQSSGLVINKNDIIFSASKSFFSFNLENGSLNWQKKISSKNNPIIDGQNIFLVSDNGLFINLHRETGEILWSTNILKVLKKKKRSTQISGYIMGSGKIYSTTLNGYLIVSSAVTGEVEYFKKISDEITSSPIISDGSMYILTEESRLLGFK